MRTRGAPALSFPPGTTTIACIPITGKPAATTDMNPSDEEIADIRAQLNELQIEHRDLDLVIDHLTLNPPPDQLLIRRLKKRKLQLKDRITLLERMLVPDIPA